ncbi:MAG TPA: sugar-transfer associated ATP-grasp domain-containing protein [Desulfuromonadales bacterium]|nr:sugar-transfer associated ATP-grasp domain-containing protein [Desulfuromonadales bacterium]
MKAKGWQAMVHWLLSPEAGQVLGMNRRNLGYVYPFNPKRFLPLADDKVLTKEALGRAGVPVPATLGTYRHFFELRRLGEDLAPHEEFVIKPARGRGGGGIIVVAGRAGASWTGISGRVLSIEELRKHITDIIFGVYSYELADAALIEQRVRQHPAMEELSPLGLADVRVILFRDNPMLAMVRVPTRKSEGRANLHRGGIGISIDPESGKTNQALHGRQEVRRHPDTGAVLSGRTLPYWDEILRVSRLAAEVFPLKYIGIDVAIAETGPMVLEINARPGLEIQNVTRRCLQALLGERGEAS